MSVTSMEFQADPGKYLRLSATEDVEITEDGKTVAKLTGVKPREKYKWESEMSRDELMAMAEGLFGIIPATRTYEEVMEEKLNEL